MLPKELMFLKNINYSSLLDGTSKTLGVIKEAIPIYYQVKPMISNIKTMFKISNIINEKEDTKKEEVNTSPMFYI